MRHYESETKTEKSLFLGLDLGQVQDYSALGIVECVRAITNGNTEVQQLNCIHLERWKLRTPYPAIVADVVKMINNFKSYQSPDCEPVLAVDATGVGAPVIDLFKREKFNAEPRPIQIVGGSNVSEEFGVTRVPKRDLVSAVQVALQSRILNIAKQLPERETLNRELQNFQVKITDAANDVYGAWREGTHDDLVLAVALALWNANKAPLHVTEQERQIFARYAG